MEESGPQSKRRWLFCDGGGSTSGSPKSAGFHVADRGTSWVAKVPVERRGVSAQAGLPEMPAFTFQATVRMDPVDPNVWTLPGGLPEE